MSGAVYQAEGRIYGRLARADPQLWRRGDLMHWAYSIRCITKYRLRVENEVPIYEWDYFNSTLLIGGNDRLAGGQRGSASAAGGGHGPMNHTTMKRDGGWTIELATPVDDVAELNLNPITLDHNIRWGDGLIPSVLALLSELTGVKETTLRRLVATNSERALIALSYVVPANIREDFAKNVRPLATPFEEMSPELQYDVTARGQRSRGPTVPAHAQGCHPLRQTKTSGSQSA